MRLITTGRIGITPIRLTMSGGPEDLVERLASRPYEGEVPATGWGGIDWSDEAVETPEGMRSAPGLPVLGQSPIGGPMAFARLLDDRLSARARALVSDADFARENAARLYDLEAIDFLFYPSGPGEFLAFVNSQLLPQVEGLIRAQLSLALDTGDGSFGFDPHPLPYRPPRDLFLWMLGRMEFHHGDLGDGLTVDLIRTLQYEDRLSRRTRVLSWADLTRVEVIHAVAEDHTFGPAKCVLSDEPLGLEADLMLKLDGAFDIYVGSSEIEHQTRGRLTRLRLVHSVGRQLIPKLYSQFDADNDWQDQDRQRLIGHCQDLLRRRFAP